MQRLKDYSENIIESLTVGVAVLDEAGRIIGWNRVLEDTFGRAKADALGQGLGEALGPANAAALVPPDTQEDFWPSITHSFPSGRAVHWALMFGSRKLG
jgi:PAS domain-containing protein